MQNILEQLHAVQIEILNVIDSICRENSIHYSLFGGTLIGAVRHEGFIPWDDDLDICMPRKDYDRFINIWSIVKPKGYILQNKENNPDFCQSFTKIFKDHTTFLQKKSDIGKIHTGIFVDIFPIDRIPDNRLKRLIFYWDIMRYQLLTRNFIPPKGNFAVKLISKIILNMTPPEKRSDKRKHLLRNITKYDCQRNLKIVSISTVEAMRHNCDSDLLDNYTELMFEGKKYMCFDKSIKLLEIQYGDYMILPPEEERIWRHHPIVIDFEHNYEELI